VFTETDVVDKKAEKEPIHVILTTSIARNVQGPISRKSHLLSFDCFINSGMEWVTL
jgi:hypothetical protein